VIKPSTRAILNDPTLLAARDEGIARLSDLFAGRLADPPFRLNGCLGASGADLTRTPSSGWPRPGQPRRDRRDARPAGVFRPLCIEFGAFGVHFTDRIFGADVYFHADQWYARRLASAVGELPAPDLDLDPTWQLARRLAEAFLACRVSVLLFGMATIASALNIAVNLYSEAFLIALHERPEAAARDLATINSVLCTLHRWYMARIPAAQLQAVCSAHRTQPPGFGQLCGCTTQLLSERLYREHVAPLDDALLGTYPHGGMIHLCGATPSISRPGAPCNPSARCSSTTAPAEDLPRYFRELRDDQIIYLNPCDAMTVEQALAHTGGRRLVIVGG